MVCVPCIAIPIFLVIFRFLIMPLINLFWKLKPGDDKIQSKPELVKECKNGVCIMAWKKAKEETESTENKTLKIE